MRDRTARINISLRPRSLAANSVPEAGPFEKRIPVNLWCTRSCCCPLLSCMLFPKSCRFHLVGFLRQDYLVARRPLWPATAEANADRLHSDVFTRATVDVPLFFYTVRSQYPMRVVVLPADCTAIITLFILLNWNPPLLYSRNKHTHSPNKWLRDWC